MTGLIAKEVDWASIIPVSGVEIGTTTAGVKYENREDLVIFRLAEGACVSAVFTKNAFAAAPVFISKDHLASQQGIRYLVINSGNANACTGDQGYADAQTICDALAKLDGISKESVLPFSTGVIGETLPTQKMIDALPKAKANLAEDHWQKGARAIMTTDTVPKAASKQINIAGETVTVTGISKGAGMIRPNMGTMLAYIATDANLDSELLDNLVKVAANKSFNRITIDGDTSTNDSCVLIATGKSSAPKITDTDSEAYQLLSNAVEEVFKALAQAIVFDGEGATKFVCVDVKNGKSAQESLNVAYAIAHSPLVKTALFASDPNWGRIVAAIGYAGVDGLDASLVDVSIDDVLIVEKGGRAPHYTEEQGQAIFDKSEFTIKVNLNRGFFSEQIWTSDLSHEYVRINAEYRS